MPSRRPVLALAVVAWLGCASGLLPLSPPAPSAALPAPSAQTAPPTRELTPSTSARENPADAPGVVAQVRRQPPRYFLLLDTESFDADEARKACGMTRGGIGWR